MGSEYSGKLDNEAGTPCLPWSSGKGSLWKYYDEKNFPEGNAADAKNYCRNPTLYYQGPWCLTQAYPGYKMCVLQYCPKQEVQELTESGDLMSDVTYHLFNNPNSPDQEEILTLDKKSTTFDPSLDETVVILHGYNAGIKDWVMDMKNALLKDKSKTKNVIAVDWSKLAGVAGGAENYLYYSV